MKKENRTSKSYRNKVYETPQPFLVYYTLLLHYKEEEDLKSVILAKSAEEAKGILFKKIKRDYLVCEIKSAQAFVVRKNSYKGKRISDKEWDSLINLAYPNGKHKLYKYNKDFKAKKKSNPHRDDMGRFSEGNVPWNKNLKVKMISNSKNGKFKSARDLKGKFKKGIKPVVIGAKEINAS